MSQDDREARRREAEERGLKYEEDSEEEQRLKKQRRLREEEESEEDDDYDDEEDDEEEERVVRNKGKKKKKAKKATPFIDEASEGSDEEDEYEGGEVEAEQDVLTPEQIRRRDERIREQRRLLDTEAEALAREYEDKYRRGAEYSKVSATKFSGAATIETARLIRERPRTEDPKLFMVRCKPGEEKALIVKLYTKYIRDKFKKPEPIDPKAVKSRWSLPPPPGAELEIFSVLAPGTSGYIYVESMREDCVKAAVRGVAGIFSGNVSIVPLEEMQDVLRVELRKDIIRKDDYVRLRGPYPYKNDLAQVIAVQDGGNKLTVKVVPRVDMNLVTLDFSAKDRQRAAPPPAKLFNADEVRAAGGSVGRDSTDQYDTFDDHKFENGLLMLDVNQRQVQPVSGKPSLEELEPFINSSTSETGEVKDEVMAMADEVRKTMSKQKKQHYEFAVGDRVMVVSGSEAGMTGTLENLDSLRSIGVVKTAQGLKVDIQLKDMVKQFSVGDHVKILAGKHSGKTGSVVSVSSGTLQKPHVFVYTDFGAEEIQVFNSEIKISSEVSSGLESLDGYKLYDLVMLDQGLHGVIVRVNSDSLRILTQNNEVKEVPTTVIRAKKNNESKHSSTPDMNNHMLNSDDQVVIVQGPYRNTEGLVKHVHRALMFVYCKAREQENAGIVVVKGRDTRIAGSFQQAQATRPGGAFPPRAAMRGGGRGKGHHDEMMGKTVRIKRGNDKGLLGTVVEGGSATHLRIELNARNRIIIVPRDNLQVEDPHYIPSEPQHVPSDDFRGSSRGGGGQGYPTPYERSDVQRGSHSFGGVGAASATASAARPEIKPMDSVRLVETGEEVLVQAVAGRDIVVLTSNGQMKIVSAANVVAL